MPQMLLYLYSLVFNLQLQKLGVITFEEKLEGSMLISFQEVWGNNGDFISKQYTGTIAMKVTCTGFPVRGVLLLFH